MALPDASSYLQLYSLEDPRETNRIRWECKDSAVIYKDSKTDRPQKFLASSFKFADATGLNEYDLKVRFEASEAGFAAAQSSSDAVAVSVANESAARQQAVAANAASIQASNTARGQLQTMLQAADSAETSFRIQADTVLDAKIDLEISNRTAAGSAESAARVAGIQGVQTQLDNLLSGSPDSLN